MASTKTYPAPWFKLHLAEYHRDTSGMTLEEKGIYLSLMVLYWEHGHTLPPNTAKKIGIKEDQKEMLEEVLDSQFPGGIHAGLDQQQAEMQRATIRSRQAASKRWEKPEQPSGTAKAQPIAALAGADDEDF